ncbi:SDR family NAD(P)-dependent oxidoreductase [Micromonospora arborensis]|uniref:SDR family NAD(P)-dependent oxidoreductase n=1 Tax=Micromonospora arborensis TaxID=2116518 RepID=UPI003CC6484A
MSGIIRRVRPRPRAAGIEAMGRRALAIQADGVDPTAVRGAVDRAAADLGRLDILVNNAAVFLVGAVINVDGGFTS